MANNQDIIICFGDRFNGFRMKKYMNKTKEKRATTTAIFNA